MKIIPNENTGRAVILESDISGGFLKKGTLGIVEGKDKLGNISVVWDAGECGIRMPLAIGDKFRFAG